MLELANLWEVEVELVFAGAVAAESLGQRLHELRSANWHGTDRNLVQQVELDLVGRDVGHDYFALIWHVVQEFSWDGIIILAIVLTSISVDTLVAMGHHEVLLQVNFNFFYFLLEKDSLRTSNDRDTSGLIRLVSVSRGLSLVRQV